MRQIQMVIQQINLENPTITSLLSKTTLRDKWLEPAEKTKQPETVKSYLGSLNQFLFSCIQNATSSLTNSTQVPHNLFNYQIKLNYGLNPAGKRRKTGSGKNELKILRS